MCDNHRPVHEVIEDLINETSLNYVIPEFLNVLKYRKISLEELNVFVSKVYSSRGEEN